MTNINTHTQKNKNSTETCQKDTEVNYEVLPLAKLGQLGTNKQTKKSIKGPPNKMSSVELNLNHESKDIHK